MFQNISLVLISNSPRRKQLLQAIGIQPIIGKIETNEIIPEGLNLLEAPSFLAQQKVEAYLKTFTPLNNHWYLGADTIVVSNDAVLEKPKNRVEALESLKKLSGNKHHVITGYYLINPDSLHVFQENIITEVHFHKLSHNILEYYVDQYQPFDKAGAYGIQEWIGKIGIRSISGDFYSVMGLPISHIMQALMSIKP